MTHFFRILSCGLSLMLVPSFGMASTFADSLQRFSFTHPQMGTVFRLVFYTDSAEKAQHAAEAAFSAVDALNACMSDYMPESELNQLCNTAGLGIAATVSEDLWRILKLSRHFAQKTEGAFDVTVGPVTRLWRRARNLKELPDSTKVMDALQSIGYQNLVFKKGKKVILKKPGMRLDLGGIAQGYAADRCLEILREHGIRNALADAGGDIALGDAPPAKKGWAIEIPFKTTEADHRKTDTTTQTLFLSNCGITTSGATFRYLEIEGKRYSHIVDPRSGWGLTHHMLVTVQAPNATTADAWATAISVLGESGIQKLKQKPGKIKVWLTESKI